MSDRSFVRFGGLAGILLAITSWAAVAVYYTLARGGKDLIGVEIFQLLYALIAFWALFGIVAVHWVVRPHGEAWSFFAVLVGVLASAATIASSLYPIAFTRDYLRQPIDPALPLPSAVSPTDPLNVMTFGLTGLWFVIANLLLWRAPVSRRLVALGFVASADLFVGFVAALGAQGSVVMLAAVVAGAVGGPLYWLWLGVTLRRLA